MTKKIDKVFDKDEPATDFRFNKEVADVFDDMVSRSVPYYEEMQRMTAELARISRATRPTSTTSAAPPAPPCSFWTGVISHPNVTLIGIDNSEEMLGRRARSSTRAA